MLILDGTPPHLHGKTHFGCSAEDEWYIVYLLRELSAHYVDLVIRYALSALLLELHASTC